jgi:hypothetical protein
MGADIKADLQIPDLWYDFYARLLPGSLFVLGLRYFCFSIKSLPSISDFVVLMIFGFICGLFSQPIASKLTWIVDRLAEKSSGITDEFFIRKLQARLKPDSNSARVLGKMHGEIIFFVQIFFLSIVLFIWARWGCQSKIPFSFLILPVISAVYAIDMAFKRIERARLFENLMDNEQNQGQRPNAG